MEIIGTARSYKSFLPLCADDYQIYVAAEVAGIFFRRQDAVVFANSRNQTIGLEREPSNPHDRNAIAIYGVCNRSRALIGYVPKDITAHVARGGMFDAIRPRLNRIYEVATDADHPDPYVEIQFQIIGPKARKQKFDAAAKKPRAPRKPSARAAEV